MLDIAQAMPPLEFSSGGVTKLVEEHPYALYGNPTVLLSEVYLNFNNMPVQIYTTELSISCKGTSEHNAQRNAKFKLMVGKIERGVKKVLFISNEEWDNCLDSVVD